jgi:CRISPR-associated protein Cmr3
MKQIQKVDKRDLVISVYPRDPLIIRDGRPFGISSESGNRAYSLGWPYPQTIAGAIRTLIGRLKENKTGRNPFTDADFLARLKATQVVGPFPRIDDRLYVSVPSDAVVYEGSEKDPQRWHALTPQPLGPEEGTNMPYESLLPVAVPANEKTVNKFQFWSEDSIQRWLADRPDKTFQPCAIEEFPKDERVHIGIEHSLGRAADQMLFSTEGLVIPDVDIKGFKRSSLVAFVRPPDDDIMGLLSDVDTLQTFGGERRLSRFKSCGSSREHKWHCTAGARICESTRFRMFLATPAIFRGGWLPGWLDPVTLVGTPPSVESSLRLKLRGACVQRWRAVSGWSMELRTEKPIRRLVPSGSVYFFEKVEGSGKDLADAWLEPVSDDEQDRRDGYGAALWGTWKCDSTKGGFNE